MVVQIEQIATCSGFKGFKPFYQLCVVGLIVQLEQLELVLHSKYSIHFLHMAKIESHAMIEQFEWNDIAQHVESIQTISCTE
jgi:hypothetical protein